MFLEASRAIFQRPGTLRLSDPHQVMPRHEQVGERTGDDQAMGILLQSAVTDLGEAEHPLDDADGVLDLGPYLRLGPVLRPLGLVHHTAMAIAAVGEVLCIRRVFLDHGGLAPVRLIAPHARLVPVQQIGQHLGIGDVGGRGRHRVDDLGSAIDPDMGLHAEIPLVSPSWFDACPGRGPWRHSWSSTAR